MQTLRPSCSTQHGEKHTFIFKDLATASHVFVRHDGSKAILQPPYDGPYRVVKKMDKSFIVDVRGRETNISIDRLKPAYILSENLEDEKVPQHHPRYIVTLPDKIQSTPAEQPETAVHPPGTQPERMTKSGRKVRFPERFQAGLS